MGKSFCVCLRGTGTLEEIDIANKEIFIAAGGEQYRYIPALNAGTEHARALVDLV